MGLTHRDGRVTGPAGDQATVRLLVDSGAAYTLLPLETWRAIKLVPKRALAFTLADGTRIERQVSELPHRAATGRGAHSVILGELGDEALLGAVTLEILGLVLNPFTRTLAADAADAGLGQRSRPRDHFEVRAPFQAAS